MGANFTENLTWRDIMAEWKDNFILSKTGGDKIKSAALRAGKISISVHRHVAYPEDTWLMDCYGLGIGMRELASKDITEAKCQAIAIVRCELEDALKAITPF